MPLRAPRHLRTSTINPLSFACSRKRTAAGDGSSAAAGVLYKNPILRPDSAASCKRRTSRSFTNGHHANAAPKALQRSVCSNAHNVSTEALVSITSKRCNCTPLCASAGAKGTYGGEMNATYRSERLSCANVGISRLNSPMPVAVGMSSITAPSGHPAPGRMASSSAHPVGAVPARRLASRPVRHRRASCSNVWARCADMGNHRVGIRTTSSPRRMTPTARPSTVSASRRRSISMEAKSGLAGTSLTM